MGAEQERWPREHAEKLLAAWRQSGQTVGDFARERGLEPSRLYYWRKALKRDKPTPVVKKKRAQPRLVPVVMRAAEEPRLLIPAKAMSNVAIDPEWVAKLVRALFAAAER